MDCEEAFYGGAAGGGKSDALLMAALQYVDAPGYDAIVLRRTFSELEKPGAIMQRSHEWLRGTDARWQDRGKRWTFPSGSTLSFGYCKLESDVYQYQGAEFDFIAFDELTQFTEWQYTYLFSRLRQLEGAPFPRRMRSASNPGGVGHGWVKKRFVSDRSQGAMFIPAKLRDNPHLDQAGYEHSLSHLPPTTRAQLLNGDWDAFEGMAFGQYNPAVHDVDAFDPPADWLRFESLDHGTTNPTVVLAWAVDYDGNCIVFDSYYKAGLIVSQHAPAILEKRDGWWPKDAQGWPVHGLVAYSDPSIWARTGLETKLGDPASVATEYLEHGVVGLAPANNDRKAGRLRVAELLKPDPDRVFPQWHSRAGEPGSPRLFFVRARCPELVEQVQNAPLLAMDSGKQGAGEIVDPDWETAHGHAVAALRYGAMSRPDPSDQPKPEDPDPRKRAVQDMVERERERDAWQDETDEYDATDLWR